MAETEDRSLDNFFAKRDKKKKERSSRAANVASGTDGSSAAAGSRPGDGRSSVSGARSGDLGSSGSGARSRDSGSAGPADKAITKDENEWKEFEQREVDYSGLRVQAMQISEKEDDDNEKREDPGDNWEEVGGGNGAEKSSGPWNKTLPVQELSCSSNSYRNPGASNAQWCI